MTKRWGAIQRVLDGALERAPPERAAYIAQACGDEVELRTEVERLLQGGHPLTLRS